MEGLKNIHNAYRGITALVLVVFFSIAGFAKTFGTTTVVLCKTAAQPVAKSLFAKVDKQAEVTVAADVQDADVDDAHVLPNLFSCYAASACADYSALNKQILIYFPIAFSYSNQLYDLYCNWKYHL